MRPIRTLRRSGRTQSRGGESGVACNVMVVDVVQQDKGAIAQNLRSKARACQELVIWTDCDREGENIGAEVKIVCREGNPRITVRRARFSAIIAKWGN